MYITSKIAILNHGRRGEMLNIKTIRNGGEVTLVLSGRIDGTTASSLEVAAQHEIGRAHV